MFVPIGRFLNSFAPLRTWLFIGVVLLVMTIIIHVFLQWIIAYKYKAISGFSGSQDNFESVLQANQFTPGFSLPENGTEFSFYIRPNVNDLYVSFVIDEDSIARWAETNTIVLHEISAPDIFSWVDGTPQDSLVVITHGMAGNFRNLPGRCVYDRNKKICYVGSFKSMTGDTHVFR